MPHIRAQEVLDHAPSCPEELAATAAAEMASKDARLQATTFAQILLHMLQELPYRNTGFILDAFPKNMPTATAMFQKTASDYTKSFWMGSKF